ncbi:MAG: DNA polymerase III subunit gamma/tau [Oscillospiraceae bacterium]
MSESYQALYRKWRPMTFSDTVGQEHVSTTLKNSILNSRIAHAYLFCGTRGTGKTSTAKIFSRAVNCENSTNGEPCNECETCKGILNGSILDVYEMDAASNRGVDDIRIIRDEVAYTPAGCKYKVYIIDEVHMLTDIAFNALLKTLEEPPKHAIFILATTEPHKLPATILSRCQRFDFRRIGVDDIAKRLTKISEAENIKATPDALELIAELGDGSMRDALSILDQCAAFEIAELRTSDIVDIVGIVDKQTLFDIADFIIKGDTVNALVKADEFMAMGKEVLNFFEDFINHFRNLLICKAGDDVSELLEKTAQATEKYKAQAALCTLGQILNFIKILSENLSQAKWMSNPQIAVEMAIVKTCTPQYNTDTDALIARIERLEHAISNGVSVAHEPQISQVPKVPNIDNIEKSNKITAKQPEQTTGQVVPPWEDEPVEATEYHSPLPKAEKKTQVSDSDLTSFDNWNQWNEALESVKDESKMLYVFLYKGTARDLGDTIEVTVKTEAAYNKISTASGIDYLSKLFSRISGQQKRASVVLYDSTKPEKSPNAHASILDLAKKKDMLGDKMNIVE